LSINLKLQIEDKLVQENFQTLQDFINEEPFLSAEFRLLERSFSSDGVDVKVAHGLSFVPKDLIQTSKKGTGTITWNFDKFDRDSLYATITGTSTTNVLTVRALVGSYSEEQ